MFSISYMYNYKKVRLKYRQFISVCNYDITSIGYNCYILLLYFPLFLCNYQSWKCCQRPELVWLILRVKRPRGKPGRNNLRRPGEFY